MRIRRRPQAQALIPSPLLHPSDPSTAPLSQPLPPTNAAANQHHWLPRKEEEKKRKLGELHHRPNVDLGDEPSPSPPSRPQGGNVVGRSSESHQPGRAAAGGGGGGGAQRQGADSHRSLENGHRDEYEWLVINAGEERPINVLMPAMPPFASLNNVKDGIKSDGPKRRRGPAVLLEGSRCSRVNGRGWRCSQPTLVGYALCEHHLGKGRQNRSANGGGGGGRSTGGPKLGRTEPASGRKSFPALAVVAGAGALPDATEPAAHLTADQFD